MAILSNLYIIHHHTNTTYNQEFKNKAKRRILHVLDDETEWYQENNDQFALLTARLKSIIFKFSFQTKPSTRTLSDALHKSLRDYDMKYRSLELLQNYWTLVDGVDKNYESRDSDNIETNELLTEEERIKQLDYDSALEEADVDEDLVTRLAYAANMPTSDKTGKGMSHDNIKNKLLSFIFDK